MTDHSIEEYWNLYRLLYPQHPFYHGLQSSAGTGPRTIEQGGYPIQNIPPVPIDSFLPRLSTGSYVTQASTNVLIQNSLTDTLPPSYLDIYSRPLPVAAPVPVPHAAQTKAALQTMMSFDKSSHLNRILFWQAKKNGMDDKKKILVMTLLLLAVNLWRLLVLVLE